MKKTKEAARRLMKTSDLHFGGKIIFALIFFSFTQFIYIYISFPRYTVYLWIVSTKIHILVKKYMVNLNQYQRKIPNISLLT